jgi:pimeloyl-ACP methyl ester carboxylesterase
MTATLAPAPPQPRRGRRGRVAGLERPLLAGGLALVTLHLLDLSLSGAATSPIGLLFIVAVPLAWWAAQPRVTRPTRIALGVSVGLLSAGVGIASHGLHVVNSGPDRYDITGVGLIVGGLLLVASGLTAVAAQRRAPRRAALGRRAAHGAGWLAGAAVAAFLVLVVFAQTLMVTHAPRWAISESALGVDHREVRFGDDLAGWYIAPRNGSAVLVGHGSGGSRARVMEEIRILARNGYGVLAFDLAGNGESRGHSNGLGDNAQPAVDAALDYVERQPGVDRIAAFGSSLGGEVLLEAAARDDRIEAVISDGAARPEDRIEVTDPAGVERAGGRLMLEAVRAVSGHEPAPQLLPLMERIAPRPVLLIAGGLEPGEVEVNRRYREQAGPTAELWEIPDTGHTAGMHVHPREYEQRVVSFLERAL